MLTALLHAALPYLPQLLGLIGAGLSAYVLVPLSKKLQADAQKSKVSAVAAKLEHVAEMVGAKVYSDMKPMLATALADGSISADERKALEAAFLTSFKAALGEAGKAELGSVLGLAGGVLEHYLGGVAVKAMAAPLPK